MQRWFQILIKQFLESWNNLIWNICIMYFELKCVHSFRSRGMVPDFLNISGTTYISPLKCKFTCLSERNLVSVSINIHLPSVVQACSLCLPCLCWRGVCSAFWSEGSVTLLGLTALLGCSVFCCSLLRSRCLHGESAGSSPVLEAVSWGRREPRAEAFCEIHSRSP